MGTVQLPLISVFACNLHKKRTFSPSAIIRQLFLLFVYVFVFVHKLYLVSLKPSSAFGVLASDQNSIHEEIMSKLKSGNACCHLVRSLVFRLVIQKYKYSKTCLKRNLKGPEHFSAKARFPFNQGTLHTV